MSTQVTYKGNTIANFTNDTKTLKTSGKYMEDDVVVTESIEAGTATTPATTITTNPVISVNTSTGLVTASYSGSSNVTPTIVSGYVTQGTAGKISTAGNVTYQLTSQPAQTITPTTSNQTIASGTYLTGSQTILGDVNLVPSNIKSGVSIFGVQGNIEGGITFIQDEEDIHGGTIRTITTNQMVSGISVITSNGLYTVASFYSASVNVVPSLESKTVTPTESQQIISANTGYEGLSTVTVNGISSTYVGTGVPTNSAADLTQNFNEVTVPWGYYSSTVAYSFPVRDINGPAVSFSSATGIFTATASITNPGYYGNQTAPRELSLTIQSAQTINTSTVDQTIASYRWLTGAQTIKSVVTSNLTAANIKSGVTVKVGDANNASRITQVTGTLVEGEDVPVFETVWSSDYETTTVTCNKTFAECLAYCENSVGWAYEIESVEGDEENVYEHALSSIIYSSQSITYIRIQNGIQQADIIYYSDGHIDFIQPSEYLIDKTITQNGFYSPTNGGVYAAVTVSVPTVYTVVHNAIMHTGFSLALSTYVKHNNTIYSKDGDTFNFNEDDVIEISVRDSYTAGNIYVDGFKVSGSIYSLIAPDRDIQIQFGSFNNCPHAHVATGKYDVIYQQLLLGNGLASSCNSVQEWCDEFTTIDARLFEGRDFSGEFTFANVSNIGSGAFARARIWNVGSQDPFTLHFPSATSIGECAFISNYGIRYVDCPEVTYLGSSAFTECRYMTSVSFPKLSSIQSNTFQYCFSLTTVDFSNVTSIGYSAFYNCSSLTTVSFPNATSISTGAFMSCGSLRVASFPKVTNIEWMAFSGCSHLETISFPNAIYLSRNAFYGCYLLSAAVFPNVSNIGSAAFYNCSSLTTANFPNATYINANAFCNCSKLISISFPNVSIICSSAFSQCFALPEISFPKVENISQLTFAQCYSLSKAIFQNLSYIGNSAFYSCYNLISLYLLGGSVCSLPGLSTFYSTPISTYTTSTGGVYGSIFVPQSLYTSYITSTNWSRFSSRFVSLTDTEIENILYPLQTLVGTSWLLFNTLNNDGMTGTYSLAGKLGKVSDFDFSSLEFYAAQDKIEIYVDDEDFALYSPGGTYGSGNWYHDDLKNITITGGTDATNRKLIKWFTDNGTQIS